MVAGLLLSTLEQKKEVVHTTLESTQRDIAKQREPINKVLAHTKRWLDAQAASETMSARRKAGEADRYAKKMAWFEQTAAAVSPA